MKKSLLPLMMIISIFLAAGQAHAALFCVTPASTGSCNDCTATGCASCAATDTCTLQGALNTAQTNGASDTVEVSPGDYDASVDTTYTYSPVGPENFTLNILGSATGARIFCSLNDTQGMIIDVSNVLGGDANADVTVQNLTFQNCKAPKSEGAGLNVRSDSADITVQQCQFLDNLADFNGGGLRTFTDGGNTLINSNLFLRNKTIADGQGGGFEGETSSGLIRFTNNILAENQSVLNGGGISVTSFSNSLQIVNNTLFNNKAPDSVEGLGGGIFAFIDDSAGIIDIYNNIVFGNTAGTDGDDIYTCEEGGTVNLFNNDFLEFISGGQSVSGSCGTNPIINQDTTNIPNNPTFVNSGTDDFHLLSTSPAIDAGTLTPAGGLPTPDFDGKTRPFGPLPDMGALEFQPIPSPTPLATPTPTPGAIVLIEGASCHLNVSTHGEPSNGGWIAILVLGGLCAWNLRSRSAR